MKISIEQMQALKIIPNSAYTAILPEFLFHSNKLEGSTFSEEELERLVAEDVVSGEHPMDDVLETRNSISVFNGLVDRLGQPLTSEMLFEMHGLLFSGTTTERMGFAGHWKEHANRIRNSSVQVAYPREVPALMAELGSTWEASRKDLGAIASYHVRFEHIHPFQDGNGRIGRFVMMKQCLENDVDLVVVDSALETPYKSWLEVAQTRGDERFFVDVLEQCQARLDEKMAAKGIVAAMPEPAEARSVLARAEAVRSPEGGNSRPDARAL